MTNPPRLPTLWRYLWSWVVGALLVVWTTLLLVASACYTESPPEQRWWAAGSFCTDTPQTGTPCRAYACMKRT